MCTQKGTESSNVKSTDSSGFYSFYTRFCEKTTPPKNWRIVFANFTSIIPITQESLCFPPSSNPSMPPSHNNPPQGSP
uniref:Ovule protein n=1 Tax=Steinernema glaseri TaxID=37863 RepID=A0A1I7ZZI7_9BILA